MQSIQNLGIAIAVFGAGKIVDAKGYLLLEVFFLLALCGKLYLKNQCIDFLYIYLMVSFRCFITHHSIVCAGQGARYLIFL